METYDLIVLGGGPAGYLAAARAGSEGLKTLLIEKDALGGVCLNEGCIPSKSLLYSAKLYDGAVYSEKYGVTVSGAKIDQETVIARKNRVVKGLVKGIAAQLKSEGVEVIKGSGKIIGFAEAGYAVATDGGEYRAKRLLIATGSEPVTPPIPGADSAKNTLTNREILELSKVPQSLVIVGGGVIGLEMASYYNSAGSRVTVIEMLDHIGGQADSDISALLMKTYQKKGVDFLLNTVVTSISDDGVTYKQGGKEHNLPAEKVLLSVGRKPVISGIGLESIGVLTAGGAIKTDRYCRTNIPNVYAAGDVNGKMMLAHTAYREAEVAVKYMTGQRDAMRYDVVPSVIYTNPEVGMVGETEETALAKGFDIEVIRLPMSYSGRYVAENEGGEGICKLIIDKAGGRILGCHVVGNAASEFIIAVGMMIETHMRVSEIKKLVFPHPTVCEIIREGIFMSKL